MKFCSNFKNNYFGNDHKFYQGHGQLRILAFVYNSMLKTSFMNIVAIGVCIANIVSNYSLMIGFQQKSLGMISGILFLISSIDSLAVFVTLFGEAGSVAHNSNEVIRSVKKYHAIHGRSLFSRKRQFITKHLKSWVGIRVEFFSSNYFDRLTPLNIILFCVQNTVSLVLLGR